MIKNIKDKVRTIKRETMTLYYALKNPKTPWYAKAFAAIVVGYALSPIDLIPDFIPVLGFLDDIILVPLGIMFAIRLIPSDIMAESRIKAKENATKPKNWVAAGIIIIIWLSICAWGIIGGLKLFGVLA
jgi:uncharacterized membrane protein YkvA (DUF1232 family)